MEVKPLRFLGISGTIQRFARKHSGRDRLVIMLIGLLTAGALLALIRGR